jgi:hypothetical protein
VDGFFTIFKKAVSELICTRLYFSHMIGTTKDSLYVLISVACWRAGLADLLTYVNLKQDSNVSYI